MKRSDARLASQTRVTRIERDYLKYPEGSVLIEMGNTKIICTASITENVPHHRKDSGLGWITAEYSMLPRATQSRSQRESNGRLRGRTQEIQRMIGRALRSVVDMGILGERTIHIDADVIQADGGTRTAAITGSFVALYDAVRFLLKEKKIDRDPIKEFLAAVSVGEVEGEIVLDLDYSEDFKAEVDMNVVMTESGRFVEVQGTAEGEPFSQKKLDEMLVLARKGISGLIKVQKKVLKK